MNFFTALSKRTSSTPVVIEMTLPCCEDEPLEEEYYLGDETPCIACGQPMGRERHEDGMNITHLSCCSELGCRELAIKTELGE